MLVVAFVGTLCTHTEEKGPGHSAGAPIRDCGIGQLSLGSWFGGKYRVQIFHGTECRKIMKPHGEILRSKCDGRIPPGRAGENDFVCEQRTPFAGGGVVVRCAADEFVPTVGFFDEAGGAEGGDELTACVMEKAETRNLKLD
jgi:hypothetical protein